MKTKSLFKFAIIFFCPLFIHAATENGIKQTKEKTIKREFKVNPNATLHIDNSYGNLNIVTWNENRIEIVVHITTSGRDQEDVKRKLDAITVNFNASPNMVSAETIFNKNQSNSWWKNLFQNNSASMQIDYFVKMPITNQVDLNNDYGNINLDKLEGRANISCDYGKIITKGLMAENNSLNFDYSDNCYFEYIKSGEINADYSGFTVAKTNNLTVNADYTDARIEIAEDVSFECDYGSMKIQKANNITGNGDYLTMDFGEVYKNITIEADYGAISIDRLMETAGNVRINSDYTGIDIGLHPQYHFRFNVDLEYASLDAPEEFEFSHRINDSGDKHYKGFYGDNSSSNSVSIESDYGSVEFYLN
ncbi:MAG TPA: hypothetical protein VFM82_08275 [Flavobacteriaceae bacterium]|nr:hypothetical protein [Flavobacteriaceae bacterium]